MRWKIYITHTLKYIKIYSKKIEKLNVLKDVVKGKRVIMIDDSIVRGTTSDRIVGMLKEAGAKKVFAVTLFSVDR